MRAPAARGVAVAFAAVALLFVLFAPMLAIRLYGASFAESSAAAGGEVTVGIAVVLRAAARRLLRGASTSLVRTTAGAMGRTSARAFVRRAVKLSTRLFFASAVAQSTGSPAAAEETQAGLGRGALALGFAALCLSFWGVLLVSNQPTLAGLLSGGTLDVPAVAALAGLPLLAYAGIHRALGRALGVRAHYRTELDGLLLQAYFTGAGSFLPLTTDVHYTGPEDAKRRLAIGSILGLLAVHGLLTLAGRWLSAPAISFLGAMFLIYAFVYCFPMQPLEGHFIWRSSKLQWLAVVLPILAAFVAWLPAGFGEIL